jgi:ABC-2 type transport system permease protein
MFWQILRHEWRVLAADATVWVVTGVFVAATAYGVWAGGRWFGFQKTALDQARAEETARYARLTKQIAEIERGATVSSFADPRNPSTAGGRLAPRYAMLPPTPVAIVAIGQSDLLPYYFRVSTDARENIVAASEIENPHRLLIGRFDLAFVVVFLYPLLILGVSYNMLSGEKETGTLALALSQPVSLAALVGGKIGLRAAVLMGTMVVSAIGALAVAGLDFGAADVAARFGLWVAALAVYGAFWFALAVWVSSLGKSSALNATILASLWLCFVVLLPSLLSLAVNVLFPVPSRVEMVQALRVASDEANAEGSKLLARYYEDHPELAAGDAEQAMADFNLVRVAVADAVEQRARPVVNRYEQQIASQQNLVARLRFLSPAIVMQEALNDVAGTGVARHRHFMTQVDAYHGQWRGYFVPLIFQKARLASLDSTPRFTYQEETISGVVQRVVLALLGLGVPTLIVGLLGIKRLRRFPVVE